jgi:branched-chain amino acid transport system ATP-binding protein
LLLDVVNVDVVYNGVIQVLRGANLAVPEGSIVALLGANGAGKTTMLRAISSLLQTENGRVTAGEIRFGGTEITNADPCSAVSRGILQVLDGRRVLKHLTVEQNLRVGAHLRRGVDAVAEIAGVVSYFPRLGELMQRVSGYLSGGEMQMLLVGRALMAKPRLMLLDEPSMGLAPTIVAELFASIKRINQSEGVSFLMVEQNAVDAIALCDHGYVMENGRIVLHGDRAALVANEDIREFYLGLSVTSQRQSFRDVKHYRRRKRWLG